MLPRKTDPPCFEAAQLASASFALCSRGFSRQAKMVPQNTQNPLGASGTERVTQADTLGAPVGDVVGENYLLSPAAFAIRATRIRAVRGAGARLAARTAQSTDSRDYVGKRSTCSIAL